MTVFSVKFLCHPNCDSDGHPVKCCKQTPAVSVINNFRQPHWADNTWFKVKVAKPDTG